MELNLQWTPPKHKIGTKFEWVKTRTNRHEVTIIGYNIEHHTDTGYTNVTYRVEYSFLNGQNIIATLARSTVDMAIMKEVA